MSPVTLTLWANDIREFVASCGDSACVVSGASAEITRVASNLRAILAALRAAAPEAEIVVTGAWDTFVGAFAVADPLYQALNAAIAAVAAAERVRFADPFAVFNPRAIPPPGSPRSAR